MNDKPKAILIVEDDLASQKLLSQILKNKGFDVDCANDGEAALSQCKAHCYDLIIMDVIMPKIDGIETLKEIRKANITSPVVILTALGKNEKRLQNDNLFVNGNTLYIQKPFHLQDLYNVVSKKIH